ncbi:hypothetical protein RSOLAG1IB_12060 [Rhizoctonia solani AG-1 IB]|uniref:Uncharacterized protein n=1 Tax=Thanatephorus cucumeris (strain AG1-IB / isolate 7/3/14) TaxID=1108050 RepID=A0A0B7FJN5_THACB|nr:hypothetical protein RSOLAG1IB_12060 [Rhizoctonia solani AG-1 IB]
MPIACLARCAETPRTARDLPYRDPDVTWPDRMEATETWRSRSGSTLSPTIPLCASLFPFILYHSKHSLRFCDSYSYSDMKTPTRWSKCISDTYGYENSTYSAAGYHSSSIFGYVPPFVSLCCGRR